jgi:hypothetical protein
MRMLKIFSVCCFIALKSFAQFEVNVKNNQIQVSGKLSNKTVHVRILDSLNNIVADKHIAVTDTFKADFVIDNPVAWSPNHPYLYKAEISPLKGKRIVIPFGLRTVSVSAKTGLLLNDWRTQLKGVNLTSRNVRQLKAAGFNTVRITRQVHDSVFEVCDKIGMLVVDESNSKKYHACIVMRGKPYEVEGLQVPDNVMFSTATPADSFFHAWQRVRNHTNVIGDFVTDTDYIDQAGNKTAHALYRDVIVYNSPVSMIVNGVPSWTWPGKVGQVMQVTVFASSKKVRLTLNDEFLALKDVPENFTVTFEIPYRPGILAAFAITSGNEVGSTSLLTK